MIPCRVVIYARDVMNITGLKEGASRLLLEKIRKHLGKTPSHSITIKDFCEFTRIEEETVREFMKNN